MSVNKRGKTWYIKFRPFGESIQLALKGCEGKRQAMAIEVELLHALRQKAYDGLTGPARDALIKLFVNQQWELPPELTPQKVTAPPKEFTFMDAIRLYTKDPRFKAIGYKLRYEAKLAHLVEFFGPDTAVKGMWAPDIKNFMAHRSSQGVKNATINREKAALSAIFQVLIEHQVLEFNPCRLVKKLPETDSEREVYIGYGDFLRIVDATPQKYHDFWWLLYLTGLRRGEAFRLKWRNIDLSSRIISFHSTETKESGIKRVPIHRDLVTILERVGKVRTLGNDSLWQWGYHVPSEAWKLAMSRLAWQNPRPRINDIRHTWKTNARRSGIDGEIREKIMGHAGRSKDISQRYGYIDNSELIRAIDKFSYDHGVTQILAVSGAKK